MEDLLYELNPWWEDNPVPQSIPRKKYMQTIEKILFNKDIIMLTGLRRVGKTTLLKQSIALLLENGIEKTHILYVSLDMLTFRNMTIQDIVRTYRKIHLIPSSQKVFLFLDEVTYKETYAQELKNLYDLGSSKIFASSSSVSMLRDSNAYLTGRARHIEVEPLDFEEYMLFRGISESKADSHLLEKHFEEYMEYGGMPEYVLTKDPTYITEMINSIVLKDIVATRGIRNPDRVFDLLRLLMERSGKQLSYRKIAHILSISDDAAKQYIQFFIETCLFYSIEQEGSLNRRIKSNKKFYCADVGIRNVITGFRDKGAVYENLVFLKIKDKIPRYYIENGVELDFITKEWLIEAKYGQKMNEKQAELFKRIKRTHKIVASGVSFFTADMERITDHHADK